MFRVANEHQEPHAMTDRFAFNISEFARAHDLGRSTVYRLLAAGQLKGRKIGKRTVITAEDAAEWRHQLDTYKSQIA